LHQSYDKGNFITTNFAWLKELNKRCKEEYTCEFRILYSNSFLKNNLFKQLTFNNLRLITTMCIYISVISLIIIKSYDYVENISVAMLNSELNNSSYAADDSVNKELEELEKKNIEIQEENKKIDDEVNETIKNTKEDTISEREKLLQKYSFEKIFDNLIKINNETVGYINIKNTDISYPVVQHKDNIFYLKHDFYKQKKTVGWIFMDYRNNAKEFDDNTIIYGHYSSGSGIMFGSLKNVLNSKWRKNKDNMIINYDTEEKSYKFKIFAAYKVDYTTDYLVINFENKDYFDVFINMIKGRSIFNTDDTLEYGDKILTLSTCAGGGNRRLVVHAVLLKENDNNE
jgi:sortase B